MKKLLLGMLKQHNKKAKQKRTDRLSASIARLLDSKEKRVLAMGASDGLLAKKLVAHTGITIEGVDVKIPKKTFIKVREYDGHTLPFKAGAFDTVLLIDVLHHCEDQKRVLSEAKRVAKQSIIIKDHVYRTFIGNSLLTFVDSLSNKPKGIVTPFNFLKKSGWDSLFSKVSLKPVYENWDYKQKSFDIIRHIMVKLK